MRWRTSSIVLVSFLMAFGSACSPRVTRNPIRVDPEAVSRESGGTDEIIEVSQKTVEGLRRCPRLEADKTYRIVLNEVVNQTGIRDYDGTIFYNQLLGQLIQDAGDRFVFLDRQSVLSERRVQADGAVTSGGVPKLTGADLSMQIELRNQTAADSRTIQYTTRLVNLDGDIYCMPPPILIKKRR